MPVSEEAIKAIINDLVKATIEDAVQTAEGVWANITEEKSAEAQKALRRFSENQINALRFPDNQKYLKGAAHNLNTLQNLAAVEVVHVRREARAFSNRLFSALIDSSFFVLDAIL